MSKSDLAFLQKQDKDASKAKDLKVKVTNVNSGPDGDSNEEAVLRKQLNAEAKKEQVSAADILFVQTALVISKRNMRELTRTRMCRTSFSRSRTRSSSRRTSLLLIRRSSISTLLPPFLRPLSPIILPRSQPLNFGARQEHDRCCRVRSC
eukprot:411855-Rhodomonas_salina.1